MNFILLLYDIFVCRYYKINTLKRSLFPHFWQTYPAVHIKLVRNWALAIDKLRIGCGIDWKLRKQAQRFVVPAYFLILINQNELNVQNQGMVVKGEII